MADTELVWERGAHAVNGDRTGDYLLVRDGCVAAQVTCQQVGPGVVDLQHTGIHPSLVGAGVGPVLVEAVLRQLRDEGLRVRATCATVSDWIAEHPDFAGMVEGAP